MTAKRKKYPHRIWSPAVGPKPGDELGRLGAVLNAMLGRLQRAFEQLRRFTADASHELRTPLTAIRVSVSRSSGAQGSAEYRDVIGSMLEEVDRLTRLVESLLVLSRADARHVHLHRVDTPLLSVAEEAASTLEVLGGGETAEDRRGGDGDLVVSADRLILRRPSSIFWIMQSNIRPSRVAFSFAYIWVRTRRRVSMS